MNDSTRPPTIACGSLLDLSVTPPACTAAASAQLMHPDFVLAWSRKILVRCVVQHTCLGHDGGADTHTDWSKATLPPLHSGCAYEIPSIFFCSILQGIAPRLPHPVFGRKVAPRERVANTIGAACMHIVCMKRIVGAPLYISIVLSSFLRDWNPLLFLVMGRTETVRLFRRRVIKRRHGFQFVLEFPRQTFYIYRHLAEYQHFKGIDP